MTRSERMAARTRDDILNAARRLFAERGYGGTSIQDIATAADVAVQTIYARLGSKRGMLIALVDKLDQEGGVFANISKVLHAAGPDEMIRAQIRLTRDLQENCSDVIGVLFSSAGTEPDLADFVKEGRGRHRYGGQKVVESLVKFKVLAPGLTPTGAVAILTALTSYESWHELRDAGLSWDEAEAALTTTLSRALLETPPDGS